MPKYAIAGTSFKPIIFANESRTNQSRMANNIVEKIRESAAVLYRELLYSLRDENLK